MPSTTRLRPEKRPRLGRTSNVEQHPFSTPHHFHRSPLFPLAQCFVHLSFALKTPWSNGTNHLLVSPLELLEKLTALIPPPRLHLLRYYGVLGPRARDRIVPTKPVEEPPAAEGNSSAPPAVIGWAALFARRFSVDISLCAACGGRLRTIAALTDPASILRYLDSVGLPPRVLRGPRRSRRSSAPPDLPSGSLPVTAIGPSES